MSHRLSRGLPYPHDLQRVACDSARLWLLVRVSYAVFLLLASLFGLLLFPEGISAALHPGWPARILLIGLTGFLVWLDRRHSHELLLHANLGVSESWFWGVSMVSAAIVDATAQALLRLA